MVFAEPQQHRVVDDPAVVRGNDDVLALADGAPGEITRRQHIGERERVGAGDFDLALDRHVPQGDVVQEVPVFLLEAGKADRKEHVVVNRVGLCGVALGRFEEGTAAQARPALDKIHVESHMRRDQEGEMRGEASRARST